MNKEKEPVRLRTKPVTGGRQSLYLDIYVDGKRRYEFLKLYLLPESSRSNKEKNRETMRLANAVKAQRLVEVQNGRFGFRTDEGGENTRLFPYFRRLAENKMAEGESQSTKKRWISCIKHIEYYEPRKTITLSEITPSWLNGLQRYLNAVTSTRSGRKLKKNTIQAYYAIVRTMLNHAVKDGLISKNPSLLTENVKGEEVERAYLTIDELNVLFENREKCSNRMIADAFLFCCLTGLRKSDVSQLTWSQVSEQEDGTVISFRQQKTKRLETMYISKVARMLIGETGEDGERVFRLMKYSGYSKILKRWMERCDIHKRITFHCSRHTFATMMLTIGTDIYTTSKLLGHTDIKTTQIYARIVDEKKKKAIDMIPDFGLKEKSNESPDSLDK